VPDLPAGGGEQRELLVRLQAVIEAKDTEIGVLRSVLNAAAVVLTAYGNVPPERAAQVTGMLLGVPVSPGWVDKASTRLAAQLGKAGLDAVMLAALAAQDALAADETPVNVLAPPPPAAPGAPPPPTASPHSTPSALPSKATPGYRHCPPSSDTSSRHPVNGHLPAAGLAAAARSGPRPTPGVGATPWRAGTTVATMGE